MDGPDRATLVLLWLHERSAEDEAMPATIPRITDGLGLDSLADQVSLLSTLSSLREDGLVVERPSTETADARTAYELTAAGRERATALEREWRDRAIVVHRDGTTTDETAGSVATAEADGLAAVLARVVDGHLYLESPTSAPDVVDREAELSRLRRQFDAVADGDQRTVLLAGEAGVGKTTLLQHAVEERADDWTVFVGRCREAPSTPYGPIVEALGDEAPSLLTVDTDANPDPADEQMYRAQVAGMHSQVGVWLAEQATQQPVALLLDDLHRADADTLDLLASVTSDLEDVPVLVFGTYRPSGVDDTRPLDDRVGTALTADCHLRLDRLDREATHLLVRTELEARDVPPSFLDALQELTGGNPLFVVETLAALRNEGRIDPATGYYPTSLDGVVPDAVETTISRRLDALDDATRTILEYGAGLGEILPIDRLVALWDGPESALRDRVGILIDGGIWLRSGPDTVRFVSTVVQRTVWESLDADQRRRIHREVAEALATEPDRSVETDGDRAATIAHHYEQAGDAGRAIDYYLTAAERATAVYAYGTAIETYERALDLARDRDDREVVFQCLEALGERSVTIGEYEDADRYFEYVSERATDAALRARIARHRAQVRIRQGAFDDAVEFAQAGLEDAPAESSEACRLLGLYSQAELERDNLSTAESLARRQLAIAESLGDPELRGLALPRLARAVRFTQDDPHLIIEHYEDAVAALEAADARQELGSVLKSLAARYREVGNYDAAESAFARCYDIADETNNYWLRAVVAINRGAFYEGTGQLSAALSSLQDGEAMAKRIDNDLLLGVALANQGSVYTELGPLADAVDTLERAIDRLEQQDSTYHVGHHRCNLAFVHFLRGDFERALTETAAAEAAVPENAFPEIEARANEVAGRVHRVQGSVERALACHRAALDAAEESSDEPTVIACRAEIAVSLSADGRIEDGLEEAERANDAVDREAVASLALDTDRALARCRRAAGDPTSAIAILDAAIDRARDASRRQTGELSCELARAHLAVGDHDAARDAARDARSLATDIGADWLARTAEDLLES